MVYHDDLDPAHQPILFPPTAQAPTPAPRARRLIGNLCYQHPWSYFPQWHFLADGIQDALQYRPTRETQSVVVLLVAYPVYIIFLPIFLLLVVPYIAVVGVLVTLPYMLAAMLKGLKWSAVDLPARAERWTAIVLRHEYSGPTRELEGSGKGDKAGALFVIAITSAPLLLGVMSVLYVTWFGE